MSRTPGTLEGAAPASAKLAYRMEEAVSCSGLTRTYIFDAIARGAVRSFRQGKRRLILADSLRAHLVELASRNIG